MSTNEVHVDAVDIAIDMLKEELPGFSHQISNSRYAIRIRGALPIASEVSMESLYYPIPQMPIFDTGEKAIRDALESDEARILRIAKETDRQTKIIKRYLGPRIQHITTQIREFGIDALNLDKVIEERVRIARSSGVEEGKQLGYEKGKSAGRLEVIQAMMESLDIQSVEHLLTTRKEEPSVDSAQE